MSLPPTGIVTFLFTDIVGSTGLARTYPAAWPDIQARHRAIFEAAVTALQGYVFQKIGDEVDAAFATALDALAAAVAVQRALRSEDWGVIELLQVRMGIHTGPASIRSADDEYEGYVTISHAKRIMSAAYGDQILLSEATEALLRDSLPPDITLRSLGEHRLKDFERIEQIYQVAAPNLPGEFPPIKSLDASPDHLPVQLTSFIGREKELDEVKQLLSQDRLLTLTGPGGSGKTRLALQAAAEMSEHFQDGVYFVALASIDDPGLVPPVIAQSLGITEAPGRAIIDRVKDDLSKKTILLVLDNFEQVIEAAALVAELLVASTGLKIIVTSRESLRVSGEREYPVLPLALPDLTQTPSQETLSQYASVELFFQRARAVKPDFEITGDNAPAVAEICSRLDGLPLAIELAAARIKLLPPHAMLTRLENRLAFLTGGARDLPARQQTLRNAIAWSFDLLDEHEKQLFCRLSIFAGGCTLDAVEAVAGGLMSGDLEPVLDEIESLLDKSLLREAESAAGEPRYVMLETLREFGLEQFEASGELDDARYRHAAYFLTLAEQGETVTESAQQVQWLNRMEQEHDNIRAALDWSKTTEGKGDLCVRLAGLAGLFWEARGYYSEGRKRLDDILAIEPAQERNAARARLLARAAELAYRQSDYVATISFAAESLAIYREAVDQQGTASALIKLGNAAVEMGDYAAGSGFSEEALSIWRQLGDKHGTARALISLGWAALRTGSDALARMRLEEALTLSRDLGDSRRIGFELSGLGEVALRQGDTMRAVQLVEESLAIRRQLGNKWGIGVSLGILGWAAIREGHWELAAARLGESLEIRQETGDQSGIAWCLERMADIALAQGQAEKAARFVGAGAALRASISSVIDPADQPEYDRRISSLRAELGQERFTAAWDEGQAFTLEQAVAFAIVAFTR